MNLFQYLIEKTFGNNQDSEDYKKACETVKQARLRGE